MSEIHFRHTFCLTFAFNGTSYYGWQRQKAVPNTIQQTMEQVLRNLFHEEDIVLSGASRTDTGVHAAGMTASFHTNGDLTCEQLLEALVKRLPHDIVILSIAEVPETFNARRDAIGKSYVYVVHTGPHTLFLKDACRHWDFIPDLDAVRKMLAVLPGTHDFRCLTGRHKCPSTVRTIYKAEIRSFGPVHCLYISGDGFLYKMVRRIAALAEEAGKGLLTADDLQRAMEAPEHFHLPDVVAPPYGLYLKKVFYDPQDKESDPLDFPPFFG